MFKLILTVAALGAAVVASPVFATAEQSSARATVQVKKVKPAPPSKEPTSRQSNYIPAAVLLSGVLLVTIANRRRNLQRVLD